MRDSPPKVRAWGRAFQPPVGVVEGHEPDLTGTTPQYSRSGGHAGTRLDVLLETESLNDRPSSPKICRPSVEDRPYLVILETQGGLGAGRREQMLPAVVIRVQVFLRVQTFPEHPQVLSLAEGDVDCPPAVAGWAPRCNKGNGKIRKAS